MKLLYLLALGAALQAQSDQLRFDVVAIKPNQSGQVASSQSPLRDKVGRYSARNVSLKSFIMWYYNVTDAQIAGGPRWLATDRFDVDAQVDGEPTTKQLAEMVRTMLADRFHLQFHFESRDLPQFVLAAPKNGLNFGPHLAKADDRSCPATPSFDPGCRAFNVSSPQSYAMEHVTFEMLAGTLKSMTGLVVSDETGLTGRYDIKLDLPPAESGTPVAFGDAFMDALRDQTGLRIETRKAPSKVLVVERAEKPTDN